MYGTQTGYSCVVEPFERTYPEFEIRVHGILHQHRDIASTQCISNLLHGKRIGRSTRTHPQQVDACRQGKLNMLRGSNLCSYRQRELVTHTPHPKETLLSHALETAGTRTGFPETGPEIIGLTDQCRGDGHYLLLALCATRTCNQHWPLEYINLIYFHYLLFSGKACVHYP